MKTGDFVDVYVSDDLSPVDACFELVAAADDLRAGVKATYRGRWIAASPGDSADKLHKAMINTAPDWPDVITAKTKVAA